MRLRPEFDVSWELEFAPGTPPLPGFTEAETRAILLTNYIETGSARGLGFSLVAGNFDGQGISFGVQQWNLGTGSLQPLLEEFARRAPDRWRAVLGDGADELRSVLRRKPAEAVAWAAPLSEPGGKRLRPPWRARFEALGREPVMQQLQLRFIRDRMDCAWGYVRDYGFTTERALALMYDLVVQQGKAWPKPQGRHALIQQRTAAEQAKKGAPLTERERLLVIADAVADTVSSRWRDKVRQRKRVIVLGKGPFRGDPAFDVDARFGLRDAPLTGSPAAPSPTAPEPTSSGLTDVLRTPAELVTVMAGIAKGVRDENALTNTVFFNRHPERGGKRIAAGETALAKEWLDVRDRIVRPALKRFPATPTPGGEPTAPAPSGPSGIPVAPEREGGAGQVRVAPPPPGARLSPLARYTGELRSSAKHRRTGNAAAIVVHTTGSGPAAWAQKSGKPAIVKALDLYLHAPMGYPHYVIDYDGFVYAVTDENEAAMHAGWGPLGGAKAFDGWMAPAWWKAAWGHTGARTPVDLLPAGTRDPNSRSIGIELLGGTKPYFTDKQYRALAALVADLAARHGISLTQVPGKALLGHEDFNPFQGDKGRADGKGGWDPGAHRSNPKFDWGRLAAYLSGGTAVARSAGVRAPAAPA